MRGAFGRNRPDKAQTGVVISTYEDALYPPRPYRYYVVQAPIPSVSSPRPSAAGSRSSPPPHVAPALVMPSVDSDAVCNPRPRMPHPPPCLQTFFECFVQPSCRGANQEPSESPLQSLSEPLNVLHYPRLLPCWQKRPQSSVKPGTAEKTTTVVGAAPSMTPTAQAVSIDLTRLAKAAGVPAELHSVFTTAHMECSSKVPAMGRSEAGVASLSQSTAPALFVVRKPERLRVCPVPRRVPARPVRRGTKVMLMSADGQHELTPAWQRTAGEGGAVHTGAAHSHCGGTVAGKKRGRDEIPLSELFNMDGEEEDDETAHPRMRAQPPAHTAVHDEDEPRIDGDDDDADDISVGLVNGDDDDLGGLDESGGSGDDGDYF